MIISSSIIYLFVIWFSGWGIYFYSGNRKLKLTTNAELAFVYFLFLSLLTFFLFKNDLKIYFPTDIDEYLFVTGGAMLAAYFIVNHIYFSIRSHYREPIVLIEEHPSDRWLQANRQSIIITGIHVIFQQFVITFLILELALIYPSLNTIALYFAIIFALLHLPLFVFKGFKFMLLYAIPAFLAGLIFPIVLLKLPPYGFVLNYFIHVSFYVVLTYIFWRENGKRA
jgi:hypothetical protein